MIPLRRIPVTQILILMVKMTVRWRITLTLRKLQRLATWTAKQRMTVTPWEL